MCVSVNLRRSFKSRYFHREEQTQRGPRARLFVKEKRKKKIRSHTLIVSPPTNPNLHAEGELYSLFFLLFHFWLYPENREHNNVALNGCALLSPGNRIHTIMAQRLMASMCRISPVSSNQITS